MFVTLLLSRQVTRGTSHRPRLVRVSLVYSPPNTHPMRDCGLLALPVLTLMLGFPNSTLWPVSDFTWTILQ